MGEPGRLSFESLGWHDDVLLTATSPSTTVRFQLPDNARQGDPLWYGLRLSYEVSGNPGEVGDWFNLVAKWNEGTVYSLVTKRPSNLDEGFSWSMVDLVNGGSSGYETGSTFSAKSTNIASYRAIQAGWNEITARLDLMDASNKDIQVVIKKESEILATAWTPASIEAQARAEINEDTIDVSVEGKNNGWHAPHLTVRTLVFRQDGVRQVYTSRKGFVDPLATVNFDEVVPNEGASPIALILTELAWGTGNEVIQAWPLEPTRPWYSSLAFRSTLGSMIALVVLWVGTPVLFRALRQSRTQ